MRFVKLWVFLATVVGSLSVVPTALAQEAAGKPNAAVSSEERESDQLYIEANRLLAKGQSRQAADLYFKSLEIRVRVLGETHTNTVAAYASYGEALRRSGDPRGALEYLSRAVSLADGAWGSTHRNTLNTLNNLALAHLEAGDLAEALRRQQAVVKLSTEALGDGDRDTLYRAATLATIMARAGRLDDAAALLNQVWQRARTSLGEQHPATVYALSRYATTLADRGQHAQAEPLKRRSLAMRRTLNGERHPLTLGDQSDLGHILIGLKRYGEAIALLEETYHVDVEVLGPSHSGTLLTLNNLAGAYYESGDRAKGTAILRDVLARHEEAYGPLHNRTLSYLASVSSALSQPATWSDAITLRGELIQRVEKLRDSGFSPDNRRALFQAWVGRYREYSAMLARSGRDDEAFRIAELAKARTLLELSTARRALNASLLSAEDRKRITTLDERIAALDSRIAMFAAQPQKRVSVETEKEEVVRELTAAMKELEGQYPKLAQLNEVRTPGVAEFKALLPADSVYVSYLVQRNLFMVIAVSPNGNVLTRRPGLIPNLAQSILAFRYLISVAPEIREAAHKILKVWRRADGSYQVFPVPPEPDAVPVEDPDQIAAYLGEKLLGPISGKLEGAKRIIVSPDAELALLPFDALRLGGRAVVEMYELQYSGSAGMYALSRARGADYARLRDRDDVLSVGGALYDPYVTVARGVSIHRDLTVPRVPQLTALLDKPAGGIPQAFKALNLQWTNAPGTERLAERVAGMFDVSRTVLLKGKDASEEKLWQLNRSGKLSRFRYLLLAAHGYLSTFEPRLSAIVLSQLGASASFDGYVTAAEWPLYDLRSDLVVLSACDTGVGRIVQGEGVMGLPFALHVAGNRNTVMTLWPVLDNSTADFVEQFFERVRAGTDQVTALAETKRAFLSGNRWKHPMYWAPFVLYGS